MKRMSALALFLLGSADLSARADTQSELAPVLDALDDVTVAGALVPQTVSSGAEAYTVLAREWLRWAMAQPWSTGPVNDATGARCGSNQSGLMWYLAGTAGGTATRACTIPAGRPLFFPLLNVTVVPQPADADTADEIAAHIAFTRSYLPLHRGSTCRLSLKLDGRELVAAPQTLDQAAWVQILTPFSLTMHADNFAGEPGSFRPVALTGGHYALITPLAPGNHKLELSGAVCSAPTTTTFATSVTYNITVVQ